MCALLVLCIHDMCTCCLCNVMYKIVQIGLCEYCIWGVVYILYCLHDVYAACVYTVFCACWICSAKHRWCYVHVGYAVLCTCGVACMLYIWCCVHDCKSGAVNMWCHVHVVHRVLWACDVVYMSCMWCYVHMVSCTHRVCGTVYMWYCVHIFQWCSVHVALCTHCVGGVVYIWCCAHVVQVGQCTGGTVYMLYIWYWCMCGIVCMSYMMCWGHVVLCMCIM